MNECPCSVEGISLVSVFQYCLVCFQLRSWEMGSWLDGMSRGKEGRERKLEISVKGQGDLQRCREERALRKPYCGLSVYNGGL